MAKGGRKRRARRKKARQPRQAPQRLRRAAAPLDHEPRGGRSAGFAA